MPAFSATIDGPWLDVVPIRVGRLPEGFGTPDRYLTASVGDGQHLRIDLYRSNEACAFEDAREWQGWLVVGWGEHLHWVDPAGRTARTFPLGGYFGRLYPAPDALFVTSAERVFRFDSSGRLVWSSGVMGIDGVVLELWLGEVLVGRGEWDPPGGWRQFRITRDTGKSLDAEPKIAGDRGHSRCKIGVSRSAATLKKGHAVSDQYISHPSHCGPHAPHQLPGMRWQQRTGGVV